MAHREQTDVLVVGAGPVGMVAALALAQRGIRVEIIDQEWRPAIHSYACALHPSTLRALQTIGLAAEVLSFGRRIDRLAFYDNQKRQGEIALANLPEPYPYMAVVPQGSLEHVIEHYLKANYGVQVRWNHRLSSLNQTTGGVVATVEKLTQTSKGYGVPELDWVVQATIETAASFLIGADGQNSFVRRHEGFKDEHYGKPECFAVYEFDLDDSFGQEAHIVLDATTTNALWPLPEKRARWSFQIPTSELAEEFPEKERGYEILERPPLSQSTHAKLKRLIAERAPWFEATIAEVHWHTEVQFQHRLAKPFSQGHCVLAGDAAHQTSPMAFQSMNLGIMEVVQLAELLKRIIREKAPIQLLQAYDRQWTRDWSCLLGKHGELRASDEASSWAKSRQNRILSCLPGGTVDAANLAQQLGLQWMEQAA